MEPLWVADTEPSTRYPLYTRGNTGEVFPHVVSALTGTLISHDVGQGQVDVLLEIGLLTPRDIDAPSVGTGVFGGYLYGNQSLFRLFGRRTPGTTVDAADQQVTGAVADLPPYRPSNGDRNLLASLRITWFLTKVLRRPDLSGLDQARESAQAWLASLPPLDTAGDDELLAFVSTYPARLGASMHRLLWFSMLAGGPRALLDRVLDKADVPAGLANRIVGGIDDVDSARLAQEMWAMSRIVADDASLSATFDAGLDDVTARLSGTALEPALRAFLDAHGHRCNDEYELAVPSWSMNPQPVLAAIDRLRHAPAERDPSVVMERLKGDSADALVTATALVPRPARPLLRRAAEVCRAGAVGRERAKDILVLENLGARLALHELVRRAAERGGPSDVRQAFCVTIDELPRFLADPTSFATTIDERSARERYLSERRPPMWFEGRISDPSTWPLRADDAGESPAEGAELSGIGVSGGRAQGPAKVVDDPGDPRGLEAGEVLVCAITDPAWTPLFLGAAAVVCETGAQQSHAAIVARELGIPAVVSVPGITRVADGTILEVDGDTGRLRVVRRADPDGQSPRS